MQNRGSRLIEDMELFVLVQQLSFTVMIGRAIQKCCILQMFLKSKFDLVVGARLLSLLIEVNGTFCSIFILFFHGLTFLRNRCYQAREQSGGSAVERLRG